MNWQHFRTFLWLRWRLQVNQLKRGGIANAVILGIVVVGAVLIALGMTVGCFVAGISALPHASPTHVLYVWDGLVVVFLFVWTTGLITELQRSEALSLDKLLYLPVAPAGAFVVNYLSSLFNFCMLVFLPGMLALALGLALGRGPAMLWLLPLVLAFFLMVTALTYQFQGWLASLMTNQRRRRTIIVAVTAVFILLAQLPNLINVIRPWKKAPEYSAFTRLNQQQAELQNEFNAGRISLAEFQKRQAQLHEEAQSAIEAHDRQTFQHLEGAVQLTNLVLPLGWLPLGAQALAEHAIVPALLAGLGLALIGTASLWRSYRTTVRLYTGQFTGGKRRRASARPAKATRPPDHFLERRLPGLSEPAAAVALAGFRSLTRAPEAKMMLLTPLIMVLVFGSMLLTRRTEIPEIARPLLAFGAMSLVLFGMAQIVGNQFGFDRGGFRVYVLCGARRRDILLGKNLAFAPVALGLGVILVALLQGLQPMRPDFFLAALVQLVPMYLLYCMAANLLAVFAPMAIPAGSFKPSNPKIIPVLLQLVFIFVMPMVLVPTLLPLGVQFVLEWLGWIKFAPVYLILVLVECLVTVALYHLVLTGEGALLQAREQKILEVVTTRVE